MDGERTARSGRRFFRHECIVQRVRVGQQPIAFRGVQRARDRERILLVLGDGLRDSFERFREKVFEVSQCRDGWRVFLTPKTRGQNWLL